MTEQEIEKIAERVARKAIADALDEVDNAGLLLHIAEHEAIGSGRVIDAEKARRTLCKCFEHEGETYAWSPGILGLISPKKNPGQFEEFCALGCTPASEGAKRRFAQLKGVVTEASKESKKASTDDQFAEWWRSVGRHLEEKKVEV